MADSRKIEGNLNVNNELDFSGMVTESITVEDGGILILRGTCGKNLTMQEGSRVSLHGMVGGNVYNNGGYLEVYGFVVGYIQTQEGQTIVYPNARVLQGER